MKIISPRIHGVLDYLTVLTLLLSPTIYAFTKTPWTLAYVLAGGYLVISLLTDYPLAAKRLIPFSIHGLVELVSVPVLFGLPWLLGFADETGARNFFIAFAVITLIVWALTDFKRVTLTRAA